MPNPNRELKINFNCLLTEADDAMLIKLAQDSDRKKAQVVREGLRLMYKMKYQRVPVCADGGDCRCPHAHIYPPSPALSTPQVADTSVAA